ncbi:ABC transporter permease [Clostridium sp. D2Q-11]|uniref:ABC transporter permease n=1 Tax=Anaeromonas frigoriresistens TaxID=2683708 RepID=A0A942Z9A9_9FIRM|nr:ABC transporter permease [Anaeromonas frigoriresistens]MBS4538929.1 ABC transporter permease [Anaeromonas frigoriresistens]
MKLPILIKTELSKQRRGFIWLMILGIPLGTTMAMFLDMYIRYHDYLYVKGQELGFTSWDILLRENHRVLGWGIFLPLFIAVIATIIHYTEFEEDNWKKLLTLPVRRWEVYISKLITIVIFSFIMIALNSLGLVLVGKVIGFPEAINYRLYGEYILYQYVAILGVVALHNFLSSHTKNVIIPVVIGFLGIIVAPGVLSKNPDLAKLIPYTYTYYINNLNVGNSSIALYGGIISMILISVVGILSFNKKDIL